MPTTEHFGISRKIIANMTSESWRTVPHVCITYNAKADGFLHVLREINSSLDEKEKISLNTAMLGIIAEGIKRCPKMNSYVYFNRFLVRGRLETFENIDFSVPMLLPGGEMMTINLHGGERMSLPQIRDGIKELYEKAKNSNMTEALFATGMTDTLREARQGKLIKSALRLVGSKTGKHKVVTLKGRERREYYKIPKEQRISPADIEQGTITVSNMGSLYRNWEGNCTILEIIPPQVAAISIGALQTAADFDKDGNVTKVKKLPLTIAFDHRALDFGDIVPFMQAMDDFFANPKCLKEWM